MKTIAEKSLVNYMGKRVSVKINDRDSIGRLVLDKYTTIVGICHFIGFNPLLEVLQITVDRTPVYPLNLEDVELLE